VLFCNGRRSSGQPVDDVAILTAMRARLAAEFRPGEASQELREESGAKLQTIRVGREMGPHLHH
jgi:hypothetical protein